MARVITEYCDIAGISTNPDMPCFYSHEGATCSIIRVDGTPQIMSDEELEERLVIFADTIGQVFSKTGHAMTITYERNANVDEEYASIFDPMKESAERKGLAIDAVLNETRELMSKHSVAERVLIAVWTFKEAVVGDQYKEEVAQRRSQHGHLPVTEYIQTPDGPYEIIAATHFAVVGSIRKALRDCGLAERLLGEGQSTDAREDLAEVRRGLLFHETPMDWQPPSSVTYPRLPRKKSASVNSLFAPAISKVLMTSAARASTDLRSIEIGGRRYAMAMMTIFPREMAPFAELKAQISAGGGRRARMPFRIAFHLEGGAAPGGIKQAISTILSSVSQGNKNLSKALESAQRSMGRDEDTYVNARCCACTWIEPYETESELNDRRSTLIRAMTSWRGPSVSDSAVDPMRLLSETVSGMNAVARSAPPTLAPVRELAMAFPFTGYAPPEPNGETVFTTMDGKAAPFRAHSSMQTSWLHLLWAPAGSGKSVLMNAMNTDFAAYYNSAMLPFIGVLDVGISSDGFIKTLKAALPDDRQNEVTYIKLRNENKAEAYRVNPFDIGLGRRQPLSREASFAANFLAELLSAVSDPRVSAVIDQLVATLYRSFSDLEVSGSVRIWQPDKDPEIDAKAKLAGIDLHQRRSWWSLVDEFMKVGDTASAARAQRYAMPTLRDAVGILSDTNMKDKFTEGLCNQCKVQIEAAINRYPMFSNPTQLDIGEARIVAIDLESVVEKNPGNDADRQKNTLMFLTGRDLFIRKVSGEVAEIDDMILPEDPELKELYVSYWRKKFAEITSIRKRFCIDEFHITGASLPMVRQIDQDVRHGRKWGFEIILASQLIKDFSELIDMASNMFVLKSDTDKSLREMQDVLGVSDAVIASVRRHVKGPGPDGSVILVVRRTKQGDSILLYRNRIGPIRLWALTTTFEDRKIRDTLYQQTGSVDLALEILASRFPTGTAVRHWNDMQSRVTAGEDVAARIVAELLSQHTSAHRRAVA